MLEDFEFELGFMTCAHIKQKRKYSGEPYAVHPIAVAKKVQAILSQPRYDYLNKFEKRVIIIAALFHDIIEDTDINYKELEFNFGIKIARIVLELTNASKFYTNLNRPQRKEMDREHLKHVSWEAKLIKLCDRICNVNDMAGCPDSGFIYKYCIESKLLLEVLKGTHEELEAELQLAIEKLRNSIER